jgi:hypothetical protein
MKRHENGARGARVLAVTLSLVLGIAAGGASEPGRGQPEGITVHGHWTIEVRNGDGSLESRREIENALIVMVGGGNSLLAGLLANHYSDPIWQVSLYGPNTTGPCRHEGSPDPWPCRITEARSPFSGTEFSKNLVLVLPLSGMAQTPEGTLQLSGSTTAVRDGTLVQVSSEWYSQARNRFGAFTGKTLEPGIQVRAGQIIQVKVVFSFS